LELWEETNHRSWCPALVIFDSEDVEPSPSPPAPLSCFAGPRGEYERKKSVELYFAALPERIANLFAIFARKRL
jgi:hypothetical protein